MKWFRWWWLLGLVPILAGLARLHFDAEMLDLLPAEVPAVQGLKIYQQHFTDARELILTVRAPDRDSAEQAARSIAEALQHANHLVATVTWEPPWQEHPEQTAELIAYLWLNQPPADFMELAGRLSGTNLVNVLRCEAEDAGGACWDLARFQRRVLKAGGRIAKHSRRLLVTLAVAVTPIWQRLLQCFARWRLPPRFGKPRRPRRRDYMPLPRHAFLAEVLRE